MELEKINFENLPSKKTPINAQNLNLLQQIFNYDEKTFMDIIIYLAKMNFIIPLNDIFYQFIINYIFFNFI